MIGGIEDAFEMRIVQPAARLPTSVVIDERSPATPRASGPPTSFPTSAPSRIIIKQPTSTASNLPMSLAARPISDDSKTSTTLPDLLVDDVAEFVEHRVGTSTSRKRAGRPCFVSAAVGKERANRLGTLTGERTRVWGAFGGRTSLVRLVPTMITRMTKAMDLLLSADKMGSGTSGLDMMYTVFQEGTLAYKAAE
jgi:hypothetical protein